MKLLKFTLGIIFLSYTICSGQAITSGTRLLPTIFSTSPNAASLGKYGQISANLFNGVPDININLYNIKVDDYQLPISASYHLASVKPEDRPGWLGLGWNLNAGGAITRVVKGGVDEVQISTYSDQTVYSYYNHYNLLDTPLWTDQSMMSYYNGNMTIAPAERMAYPAPDEFMFNINGLSGSFYKNHKGNWVVKANKKLDIKVTEVLRSDFKLRETSWFPSNNTTFTIKRIIYGFTLTDENGIKYVFGQNPTALEFTAGPDSTSDSFRPNFVVKSWYITSIILPNGKTIGFQYKTNETQNASYDVVTKAVYKQYMSSSFISYTTSGGGNWQSSTSGGNEKSLIRMYVTYLDKITTPDAEITFNSSQSNDLDYDLQNSPWTPYNIDYTHSPSTIYTDGEELHWYKLDNFVVKTKVDFKQIYKASFSFLETPTSRLFLNSINESGELNSATDKKYLFNYNSTALPAYNSRKIDHWGYYNNKDFYASVAPAESPNYSRAQMRTTYPTYRNMDAAYIQAGTLTKITFPTGGTTEFFYEPNDFSKVVDKVNTGFSLVNATSNNEMGGGLRIKKTISTPFNNGTPVVKEYFYVKDYKNNNMISSGILSGRAVYVEEGYSGSNQFFKLSSNAFAELNDTSGSPVTYSTVVEKLSDGSFTEYSFANHDNGYMDSPANAYLFSSNDLALMATMTKRISFNSLQSERGNLLSEKIYNSAKNLVQTTNNYYNDDPSRLTSEIRSLDFSETVIGTPVGSGPFTELSAVYLIDKLSAYSIFSHQTYLKKTEKITHDFSNNSDFVETTNFTYSNATGFHQLKTAITTTSTNQQQETRYFYAPDSQMSAEPNISTLISSNMVSLPLNVQEYKLGEKISETNTKYKVVTSPSQKIFPEFVFAKKGDVVANPLEKKITYTYSATTGNLIEYCLENGTPVCILWGYSNSIPVAKIENATFQNPSPYPGAISLSPYTTAIGNLQSATYWNESSETSFLSALNSFRSSLPATTQVTTFTHKPLVGVSTIIDPKGIVTMFGYDVYGKLKNTKVKDLSGNTNLVSENEYHFKP